MGLLWVDSHLGRHFSTDQAAQETITQRPYQYVRRPPYLAILVSRAAPALTLASILALVLVLA